MVNNETTKIQNEKDLKFYRFMVVMAFVCSIVIALIVGITTVDSYKAGASVTNAFTDALMPKSIVGTADGGAEGMTFYREKNKEYDIDKDEPLKAFNYYVLTESGEKQYLDDGMYYPPEYYMENSTAEPVAVYLGFYFRLMQNLQVFKNVMRVIVAILCIGLGVGLIFIWYRSWSIREDKKKEQERLFNERFNKKN